VTRKPLIFGLIVVALIVLGAAAWYVTSSSSSDSAVPDSNASQAVTLTAWDRRMGSPKAPILMVEYAAPQCPIAPISTRNLPAPQEAVHRHRQGVLCASRVSARPADVAAEAMARCLPEDNYFQFLDLLWRNQIKWDPEISRCGRACGPRCNGPHRGPERGKVDSCIADQAQAQRITQVGQDATTKYAINSVPTFVVNGEVRQFTGEWNELQAYLNGLLKK